MILSTVCNRLDSRDSPDVVCALVFVDGVYKAGFATTQTAYQNAVGTIFESLDKLERLLTGKNYLFGNQLTEADIRLWVTIVRQSWLIFYSTQ